MKLLQKIKKIFLGSKSDDGVVISDNNSGHLVVNEKTNIPFKKDYWFVTPNDGISPDISEVKEFTEEEKNSIKFEGCPFEYNELTGNYRISIPTIKNPEESKKKM